MTRFLPLVVMAIVACGGESDPPQQTPISGAALDRIEAGIASWAEGRGWTWSITRAEDGSLVHIEIEISPEANSIARQGYCENLESAVREALEPNQAATLDLLVDSETVRSCSP